VALGTLAAGVASAYYHFVYFPFRTGPFSPVPVKFDLNALPDRTVQFFVSEEGPEPVAPGDSLNAIVSQLQFAARQWNDVPTSELRIRFGGFRDTTQLQSTPGIDVVFDDDIPPGIIFQAGPVTRAEVDWNTAKFVPLIRSRLQIRRSLADRPSWTEDFFALLVHEFGHTLGLQHTFTSAAMATPITQAVTKARPLGADDVAGISLLYPTARFLASTGSISGRVTLNNAGVNLASVVALPPNGQAVSTLANPDGTYRIDGLAPGSYLVYVHPVPPALFGEVTPGNLVLPRDGAQQPFVPGANFTAQFFPNTREWRQAVPLAVNAGRTVENIDFAVRARTAPAVHSVQLYGFLGRVAVKSPPVRTETQTLLVFTGTGAVTAAGQPVAGLRADIIGDGVEVVPGSLGAYGAPPYLQMTVRAGVTANGFRHLVLATADDIYVLPAAFYMVSRPAPSISGLTLDPDEQGGLVAVLRGAGFVPESRVLFDGVPARVRRVAGDVIEAVPPVVSGAFDARAAVLNPDGQTAQLALGSAAPVSLAVANNRLESLEIQPNFLPAGVDALVEVTGSGVSFVEGQTAIGFGSSDVTVRRVWVSSSTRLLVNVSVSAGAPAGLSPVTAVTGLQSARQKAAFRTAPATAEVSLRAPVLNVATGLAGVPPGGTAVVSVANAPATLNGWTLTVNGQPAAIRSLAGDQITFQVPAEAALGPAVVTLVGPAGPISHRIGMNIDAPPPLIGAIRGAGDRVIDAANPARPGETITIHVTNLRETEAENVRVTIGDADAGAVALTVLANGLSQLRVTVPTIAESAGAPVVVIAGTRLSPAVALPVKP
jgi:uncharacterized protein (TIGR03437 family)